MNFRELISCSKNLSNWIGEAIDNVELKWIPKVHLSGACLQVGLSHHAAIIALLDGGRHASALALMRPQMECFLRGVWINKAATKDRLDAFIRGGNLKIGEIIAELEEAAVFDHGRIRAIKNEVWSDFCDFTHCGGNTIRSHFKGDELAPNFSDDYLSRALVSSNAWALMTGLWVAQLSENSDLAATFLAKAAEQPR